MGKGIHRFEIRKCVECGQDFKVRDRPDSHTCIKCFRAIKKTARRLAVLNEKATAKQESDMRTHYICRHKPPPLAFDDEPS